jgi:hypothetical protein
MDTNAIEALGPRLEAYLADFSDCFNRSGVVGESGPLCTWTIKRPAS